MFLYNELYCSVEPTVVFISKRSLNLAKGFAVKEDDGGDASCLFLMCRGDPIHSKRMPVLLLHTADEIAIGIDFCCLADDGGVDGIESEPY